MRATSAPVIERPGDMAYVLSALKKREILFIDEIHRLRPAVEEVLYSAMEDYTLDISLGQDSTSRSVKINLPAFTLIGATTKAGALTQPLLSRFGIVNQFQFYEVSDLKQIVRCNADYLKIEIDAGGVEEIACRSRGTPRIVTRILRRVRDFTQVAKHKIITKQAADDALNKMDIDIKGLDNQDRRILKTIIEKFNGALWVSIILPPLSERILPLSRTCMNLISYRWVLSNERRVVELPCLIICYYFIISFMINKKIFSITLLFLLSNFFICILTSSFLLAAEKRTNVKKRINLKKKVAVLIFQDSPTSLSLAKNNLVITAEGVNHGARVYAFANRKAIFDTKKSIIIGDNQYTGAFKIIKNGKKILLINEVDMEQYLAGVLIGEISSSWADAAIQAQAIAARSYAYHLMSINKDKVYHLVSTTHAQVFHGTYKMDANLEKNIKQTKHLVLLHRGKPIITFFTRVVAVRRHALMKSGAKRRKNFHIFKMCAVITARRILITDGYITYPKTK